MSSLIYFIGNAECKNPITVPIIGMTATSSSNNEENILFDSEKIGKKYSNYSIYILYKAYFTISTTNSNPR